MAEENLTALIFQLQKEIENIRDDFTANNNAFFMCSMALIIFLMQCGFAFLEAGAVRSKNTTNILIKNLLDSCIAVVGYYAIGYAFAYGENDSNWKLFIGTKGFFLNGINNYPKFFFQYVFAATSATIVSGAVAERCEFVNYITYCTIISSFVYPILTHWGWSTHGWMKQGIKTENISTTYLDFAGSGVVHLCGGTISFIAAYMMGPRIGKFPDKNIGDSSPELQGHSVPFAALGGFILMFGFLAFNGGSMADIVKPGEGNIVALAMINTILSGAFAALVYLIIHFLTNGKWTLLLTINACLAGMVAACAGCNRTMPWGSFFTGIGAGLMYLALSKLMLRLKIDDPLDAFAVHAGGGFWGLMSVCIIAKEGIGYRIVDAINGDNSKVGEAFAQLGWNCVCACAIIIWSTITMVPVFLFLKKIGKFRVSPEVEIKGLDIYKHGEAAYPIHAYGHGWDDIVLEDGTRQFGKFSDKVEFSIEELATAYERRTSVIPANMSRRISYFHNPKRYEHPEHHHNALKSADESSSSKKMIKDKSMMNGLHPKSAEFYNNKPMPISQENQNMQIPNIQIEEASEQGSEDGPWAL